MFGAFRERLSVISHGKQKTIYNYRLSVSKDMVILAMSTIN